ncbi:S-adenosyl-L-methionine-dependent methyltransferase [Exidia glandulosa HHB12029]|uniref:S-adenosyl-L-methionine-dependent methyltransferase n=1 Tax=Exidia glandulosa HHB12029 TaxID=1314781 RepID=A0A165GAR9_EXIGL|nr:S-adenosyl-L-methionine-dependent methyltransferase [Exidia glandulosa HHB12029]
MSNTVHSVAANGFGAGKGELYDKARPSYPAEALAAIRDNLRTSAPYNILELGAGTGIFTRALLASPSFKDAISAVHAVEPSDGFRAVLAETTPPVVVARAGTFADTGAPDAWADAVIVAQAWHWCPDHDAAVTEIARTLKPGGVAFFIWNLEDRDAASWVARLRDTIEVHEKGTPQYRLGLWRATFGTKSYVNFFEKEEELVWSYALPTTAEAVVTRAHTKSYIAMLPEDEKTKVSENVRKILADEPKTWINEAEGVFEYPYKTTLIVMRKK